MPKFYRVTVYRTTQETIELIMHAEDKEEAQTKAEQAAPAQPPDKWEVTDCEYSSEISNAPWQAPLPDEQARCKAIDAEVRGNKYLADANNAAERGQNEKAERLYAKGQFWLDRYNKLMGN